MSDRAVGYARKSVKAERQISIEDQHRRITEFCSDMDLLRIYTDDGHSGGKWDRPAFQDMLADAMAGGFEWVIVDDQDRFARDVEWNARAIRTLRGAGVRVQDTRGGMDSETADGVAMINVKATFAQHQRDRTSELRTKRLYEKARQGMFIGPTPVGYKTVETKSVRARYPHLVRALRV